MFDVAVFKTLSEEELRRETVFGCVLTIPGTEYSIKEETMYFPGKGICHEVWIYVAFYEYVRNNSEVLLLLVIWV